MSEFNRCYNHDDDDSGHKTGIDPGMCFRGHMVRGTYNKGLGTLPQRVQGWPVVGSLESIAPCNLMLSSPQMSKEG